MPMENAPLRAYLVDDEPLAIERLERMLGSFDGLSIAGRATDPAAALDFLGGASGTSIDVLFLDIQMPGLNGFELLARLPEQPFVIFTTAYDEYALRAFQENAIDYLMKPIEAETLARALKKLDRLRPIAKPGWQQSPQFPAQGVGRLAARRAARLSASHRQPCRRAHLVSGCGRGESLPGPGQAHLCRGELPSALH
jgi:two-component system LytT family response regulator